MKITLEPTPIMTDINGVPTRVWQGHTANGVPIHAHIVLIGVDKEADSRELDAILREVAPPREDLVGYSTSIRMVMD